MSDPPSVSVVVPTYQRRRTVGATIAALLVQDLDRPFEVVVVDNGTSDGTTALLAALADDDSRLRVLRIDDNHGPGPARNAGWRAARSPVVAFTDDDCVPGPGWLRAVVAAIDGGADVVTGVTVPAEDAMASAGPFSHWVNVRGPMPWFPTCNIAYRADLLADLDGFDESFTAQFGSSFGDDTDLGWRAMEAGAVVEFAPDAVVVHEVTPSDFRGWVGARRRRGGVPEVVARHPGLRAQLVHPLVYERSHPPAALAAVGLALGVTGPRRPWRWFVAGLLVLPYVRFRGFGRGRRLPHAGMSRPWVVAGHLVADLVEIGVVVRASRRSRTWLA